MNNNDNFDIKRKFILLYDKAKIGDINSFTKLIDIDNLNDINEINPLYLACEAQWIYKHSRYYNKDIWNEMINILFNNKIIFDKINNSEALIIFF